MDIPGNDTRWRASWKFLRLKLVQVISLFLLCDLLATGALWIEASVPNALAQWLRSQTITDQYLREAFSVLFILLLVLRWPEAREEARKPNFWDRRPGAAQMIVGLVLSAGVVLWWMRR